MTRFTGTLYARCIIVEDDARSFHQAMIDAANQMEQAVQAYGWGQVVITEPGGEIVFDQPTDETQ